MRASPVPYDLAAICREFSLRGCFVEGRPHGSGHINDTFAVTFDQAGARGRYILQRINHNVFKNVPALMENIARVTAHVAARTAAGGRDGAARTALTLVPTHDDRPYHRDATGNYWRAYLFIERASTHDIIRSPDQAYEAALAFGEFQRHLADLPGLRLHETIPGFHHTRRRFQALEAASRADPAGRARLAAAEIDFARRHEGLVDVLLESHARGEIPERITHNDAKLNNVMLDDATGRGVCVIDLDTVMPGLALYDFGDLVRSGTNSAAEDTPDPSRVRMQLPVFEALARGYLASAGEMLNDAELAHLVLAARLITFEIGIRFLTDFLEGDTYFKTARPHHNLDRCRCQFALLRSMEAQESEMNRLVDRVTS